MFGAHFRSPDGNDLLSPDNGINPAILQQCFQVFTGLTRVALKIGFHPPSRPFLVSTSPTRKMTRWSPFCHSLKPIQQLLFHVGCIFSPFGLWPLWLHLWNVAQLSPLLRCAPWLLPPRGLSPVHPLSALRIYSHTAPSKRSDSYPFTCPSLSGLWGPWGKGVALCLRSPSACHSARCTLTCHCSNALLQGCSPTASSCFPARGADWPKMTCFMAPGHQSSSVAGFPISFAYVLGVVLWRR